MDKNLFEKLIYLIKDYIDKYVECLIFILFYLMLC